MALPATPPTPRSNDKETYCDALLLNAGTATQTPGSAVMISASATAAVVLTLWSGVLVTVNPPVGDTIYPFQITKYSVTTGTVTAAYNLFK